MLQLKDIAGTICAGNNGIYPKVIKKTAGGLNQMVLIFFYSNHILTAILTHPHPGAAGQ